MGLNANPTMHFVHVGIARTLCFEDCHAHPANVRLAASTSHMVASLCFLHRCCAFRAILYVQFLLQLLERLITTRGNVLIQYSAHV